MIHRNSKRFTILKKDNIQQFRNKSRYKLSKFDYEDIMMSQRFASNIRYLIPLYKRKLAAEDILDEMGSGYNFCDELETNYRVFKRLRKTAKNLYHTLLKAGVDFSTNDFIRSEWFIKFNKSYLQFSRLSVGWIVECYVLPVNRLVELHGIYGMGINRSFTKNELEYKFFADYIQNLTKMTSEDEGVFVYENMSEKDYEIFQYFFRNDSKNNKYGLLQRLKSYNIIDFNFFSQEPENILKLLAMFYDVEKRNNIILTSFWKSPSKEDSDLIDQKLKTRNQNLVLKIKSELAKEISVYRAAVSADKINRIEDSWTSLINFINFSCWDIRAKKNITKEQLKRINILSSKFCNKFGFEKSNVIYSYNEPLFITVYLKLLQREKIGEMEDLLMVNKAILSSCKNEVSDSIIEFIAGLEGTIHIDEVKTFLLDHKDEIISSVLNDISIVDNNGKIKTQKLFVSVCKVIEDFVDVLEETDIKINEENKISLQKIIIIFITIAEFFLDKNELPALFYHSSHTDKRTPSAELKRGKNGLRLNKTRFAKKYLYNMWKFHPAGIDITKLKLIFDFENIIFNLEKRVYSANNFSAMKVLNTYYHTLLICIEDGTLNLDKYINDFNNVLWGDYNAVYTPNYTYFGFFLSMIHIDNPLKETRDAILAINRSIQSGNEFFILDIQLSKFVDGKFSNSILKYKYKFEISHECKTIKLVDVEADYIKSIDIFEWLK